MANKVYKVNRNGLERLVESMAYETVSRLKKNEEVIDINESKLMRLVEDMTKESLKAIKEAYDPYEGLDDFDHNDFEHLWNPEPHHIEMLDSYYGKGHSRFMNSFPEEEYLSEALKTAEFDYESFCESLKPNPSVRACSLLSYFLQYLKIKDKRKAKIAFTRAVDSCISSQMMNMRNSRGYARYYEARLEWYKVLRQETINVNPTTTEEATEAIKRVIDSKALEREVQKKTDAENEKRTAYNNDIDSEFSDIKDTYSWLKGHDFNSMTVGELYDLFLELRERQNKIHSLNLKTGHNTNWKMAPPLLYIGKLCLKKIDEQLPNEKCYDLGWVNGWGSKYESDEEREKREYLLNKAESLRKIHPYTIAEYIANKGDCFNWTRQSASYWRGGVYVDNDGNPVMALRSKVDSSG